MTRRRTARQCALMLSAAMTLAESARSGVWVTDPVVGLAAEYSSNPALLYVEHGAETDGAVLIDAPTSYHADDMIFAIQPSVRISNRSGYSSLTSDYAHLTVDGEIDAERNTVVLTAQLARDSSLYYNYELNGSTGVRRDTTLADLAWQHSLTELVNFNLDLDSSRVIYGQSTGFTTLADYHYTTLVPGLIWKTSERTTLTLSGAAGLYDSSDGSTKSSNANLQLGLTRELTELWSLSASAGYSREADKISADEFAGYEIKDGYLIPVFALETYRTASSGSIFAANLKRQGELLSVNAGASRSIVPSGFAFLSRQTTYQAGLDYRWTERWTFDGHASRLMSSFPQAFGAVQRQSYWSLGLSAAWQMTEKWTVTWSATRLNSKYAPPNVDVNNGGFGIQISRHFDRIEWH
jgi:hypothetical protein